MPPTFRLTSLWTGASQTILNGDADASGAEHDASVCGVITDPEPSDDLDVKPLEEVLEMAAVA